MTRDANIKLLVNSAIDIGEVDAEIVNRRG
jgi:hypothetical protein